MAKGDIPEMRLTTKMSHEIRSPLNIILGYAQILLSREDLGGEARKAAEAIDREGRHLLRLIDDIFGLSKIEGGPELQLPPADVSSPPKDTSRDQIRGLVSAVPLTALIVDDDKLSRTMLSHLLTKAKITTLEANNGLEALEVLRDCRPNIIFMDRYMPEMDGVDAITEIQRRFGAAAPPVVMITAAAFDSPEETMAQPGVAGILIKPCDIRQVFTCMATVLGLPLRPGPAAATPEPAQPPPPLPEIPAEMSLPAELHGRLLAAAKLGKISRLRELANELDATPAASRTFTNLFRKHLEVYAMKEIIELVQQTKPTRMNRP